MDHGAYNGRMVGEWMMHDLLLPLGLAWILQGILLYWAYGFLSRFARDGAPKDYIAAGRPEGLRDVTRIFRCFSLGATVLAMCGAAALIAYQTSA